MADNVLMAQLPIAPTEGYEDAIVIPEITANNFEIKHGLLNLVQTTSSTQAVSSDVAELKDLGVGISSRLEKNKPQLAPLVNQPVGSSMTAPQTHGVSKTVFERYVTANDAVLRNCKKHKVKTAIPNGKSGLHAFKSMLLLLASTSVFWKLLHWTKAVNHDAEVTKDTMHPANNGSTENVQPPVVQIQSRNQNPEPNEVLGFSNVIASGQFTPYSEGLLFLMLLQLSSFWGHEPPPPLPNQEQYLPEVRKELKLCEAKTVEPSVNEPPEVELKELPPHLEYAFLEGDDKFCCYNC
ncbi:hypothetical protein Tco_0149449 [Tanacetum coccineum]